MYYISKSFHHILMCVSELRYMIYIYSMFFWKDISNDILFYIDIRMMLSPKTGKRPASHPGGLGRLLGKRKVHRDSAAPALLWPSGGWLSKIARFHAISCYFHLFPRKSTHIGEHQPDIPDQTITGWWLTYPSQKWWSSSVAMMTFPTEWKVINNVPVTTNQIYELHGLSVYVAYCIAV